MFLVNDLTLVQSASSLRPVDLDSWRTGYYPLKTVRTLKFHTDFISKVSLTLS